MARRRSNIGQTRSLLYGLARLMGDVQAVSHGQGSVETVKMRGARMAGHTLDLPILENRLWKAACTIRGPMDAPKFKDYLDHDCCGGTTCQE